MTLSSTTDPYGVARACHEPRRTLALSTPEPATATKATRARVEYRRKTFSRSSADIVDCTSTIVRSPPSHTATNTT